MKKCKKGANNVMKLWVTAGGTGSAWHICNMVNKYYKDEIELFVSDINQPFLVASSTLANHFFVVPPVKEEGYASYMYQLLKENEIDVIIPLIPWEQAFFSMDNPEFAKLGIKSLAPDSRTSDFLNDKISLGCFCEQEGIPTIRNYSLEDWKQGKLDINATYFVKLKDGFGSMGAKKVSGVELAEEDFITGVVQEYCGEGSIVNEITVEAFYSHEKLYTIARRRIESKSGVCTKAEILEVPEAREVIEKMLKRLAFPTVFNVQFVRHNNEWKVMDVNLRLAAGTGLSYAAGFQLIRALLADLLGKDVPEEWFQTEKGIKSILRVYQEVVIK